MGHNGFSAKYEQGALFPVYQDVLLQSRIFFYNLFSKIVVLVVIKIKKGI